MLRIRFAFLAVGIIPMILAEVGFAQPEQAAGLVFTRPPGWSVLQLQFTALTSPEGQASVTFFPEEPFRGSAQQRHDELWARIVSRSKAILSPGRQSQTGDFLETCAFFRIADISSDATPSELLEAYPFICLYTAVKDGLAYNLQLYALNDRPFSTNVTAARAMVASMSPSRRATSTGPTSAVATNVPANTPMATQAFSQDRIPILRYDEPSGFYHSAITPPDDYSAAQFNASFQVYPFRAFSGDIGRAFQTTLLRDWIDPRYQETNVVGRPEFKTGNFPGAQFIIAAKFVESSVGVPKTRMRYLIVAGGTAALLDMSASDAMTWQRFLPLLDTWFATVRVDSGATAPRVTHNPGPGARAMAGVYMALTNKSEYTPVGNRTVLAAYYYIFSLDGRVYRAYDNSPGDPSRFDFDAAQRADAVNSGFYSLNGNQLRIEMGSQRREVTTTTVEGGHFKIGSAVFDRQ